jgi:oligopeptide/dipeptide ABC transporter ATP-binding protein
VTQAPIVPDDHELLQMRDVTVGFPAKRGILLASNKVNLQLRPGTTLGLVGESGSGKSVTLRSIIDMVPPPGEVLDGEVLWRGQDVYQLSKSELRSIRGREIAMIFQDPGASLSPVSSVGSQLAEIYRVRVGLSRKEARAQAIELLGDMGIASASTRFRDYPHQLSGGMKQRVMIAMAVAFGPSLVLADEPTTGLDVTIQDQILVLLSDLQRRSGMSMVLVSHDLGVIARMCDAIAVMYGGFVVEYGSRDDIIKAPRHPYTRALLAAELVFTPTSGRERLVPIAGQPPDLANLPPGCPFAPRCPYARADCEQVQMTLDSDIEGHRSACPVVGVA